MNVKDIPVKVIGPGSQPVSEDGETLSYMSMPNDMAKYVQPQLPEPDDMLRFAGARSAMDWLRRALANDKSGGTASLANLAALDADSREIVNQILGEGEVSITYDDAIRARTQESVLAGVWRTFYFSGDDLLIADIVEVADVPRLVRATDGREQPVDTSSDGLPNDVMNALPILVELESHLEQYLADGSTNSINLTLLPLSDADVEFLDRRLGRGPVDILSRAYGKCQVISTRTPNVWWVRYYNSMNTLILNTLEVVDVPLVVGAAPEDLADSRVRLDEILSPYWSDVA